jgi:hypothetical protein
MSYTIIRNNARVRFNENLTYLNFLTAEEPNDPTIPPSLELKIMKGLFYVHLYSSLEKTLNDLIEQTLTLINSKNVKNKHYNLSFNTISLLNKLQSFKECGYRNFFSKAIEIFEALNSEQIPTLNETVFSNSLQNVWTSTIIEILQAFGINNFMVQPRIRTTIDEIVDKRNAVAHGRESASVIGERFRTDVLRTKMTVIMNFSYDLIDTFENYHDNSRYLKPQAKRIYSTT